MNMRYVQMELEESPVNLRALCTTVDKIFDKGSVLSPLVVIYGLNGTRLQQTLEDLDDSAKRYVLAQKLSLMACNPNVIGIALAIEATRVGVESNGGDDSFDAISLREIAKMARDVQQGKCEGEVMREETILLTYDDRDTGSWVCMRPILEDRELATEWECGKYESDPAHPLHVNDIPLLQGYFQRAEAWQELWHYDTSKLESALEPLQEFMKDDAQ